MSSSRPSEMYAGVGQADFRPSVWEMGREIAIRLSCLRRPYWRFMSWFSANRPYLQLIKRVAHLEGDVAECGVFRGRTLLRLAMYVNSVNKRKTVHGFDSFQGFPPRSVTEGDLGPNRTMTKVRNRFKRAGSARDRIERVASHLNLELEVHAGYFEDTVPQVVARGRRFCFIHLDCDIYESYRTCLASLYDALVPGGIMLFDEYACPVWPGATRAVDEFFEGKRERPIRCDDPGRPEKPRYYIVKEHPSVQARCA